MSAVSWRDDAELFGLIRTRLFTAVIGDILDDLGLHDQFLPREIRPLAENMILAGRAMTVLEADLDRHDAGNPFGRMLEALDDLKPGEVYLASGGAPTYAMWGELMATRATHLGAAGAVLNGSSRDTRAIVAMNFPTFSLGSYAQDQRGRGKVLDYRVPVRIGRVNVDPGDIVFGDIDGVVVIPRSAESDALTRALEKVDKESQVRTAIERGMSTVDALATFGVM